MQLLASNKTIEAPPRTAINYDQRNPLVIAAGWVERINLAAEMENYIADELQYLFSIQGMELWGPSGGDHAVLDPAQQDNKTDFQKQNLKSLTIGDVHIVRGWATAGDWTGSFLRISYDAGPDTKLAAAAGGVLGPNIRLYINVGGVGAPPLLTMPYDPQSHRYALELWSYPGADLRSRLDVKGVAAFDRGEILAGTGLVQGTLADLSREGKDGLQMPNVDPGHTMHPVKPLTIELAFADATARTWDSNGGVNYRYQFNMLLRGWHNYLGVGTSRSPHGGVGILHYRNLLSNYFGYDRLDELGREVEPWMFDAGGIKPGVPKREASFTMDYLDLHLLRPGCGIGLHRHRDNQEIFFLMEGAGLMFCGDWCQLDKRVRCLEARYLKPGHFALIKPGGFHGLYNVRDENMTLLMFGGYD